MRKTLPALLPVLALGLAFAFPASALAVPHCQATIQGTSLSSPALTTTVPGMRLTPAAALRIVQASSRVKKMVDNKNAIQHKVFVLPPGCWQGTYYAPGHAPNLSEADKVTVDDHTGKIVEAWQGLAVGELLARGQAPLGVFE